MKISLSCLFLSLCICSFGSAQDSTAARRYYFYKPENRTFGSESQVGPVSVFLNGGYDMLRNGGHPKNIFTWDYKGDGEHVWKNMRDPIGNIRKFGWKEFVHQEIFNFTIETIPPMITNVLEKNGLTIAQIDYIILHQANKYILEFLINLIGIDKAKCHLDMQSHGNTVSNTIPIAMKDSLSRKSVSAGDTVLIAGFGVGYSWGSSIIRV